MVVTNEIKVKETAGLTLTELISFLEKYFSSIKPNKYMCFVAKIRESWKDFVVNYFLENGHDIKIYDNSDYVQFSSVKRSEKGTLTECGFPYSYELTRACEETSMPMVIDDDEDSKDIYRHFNIEYSYGGTTLFQHVDTNDVLKYLIEEKGYFPYVRVSKKF